MFVNNPVEKSLVFLNYKNEVCPIIEDTKQIKFIFTQQKKNAFKYICLNTYEEAEQYLKENNNLFEVLQYNKAVKPFFDIDIYNDENINK